MAEDLKSYPIANMVQGVSQQAAQNRRETQCEAQFDCINSPVLGVDARPHLEFTALIEDADYSHSFFYEIKRGTDEHYLVVITKDSPSVLEVFDLFTGAPCSVTFEGDAQDYLETLANPEDVFKATTVEDYTFIANREILPAIDTSVKSPAARNEAIVYWRASAYSVTFQLAVTYNNKVYTWTYVTPDNSVPANAEYITTNAVAATFFRSLTGTPAAPTTSGATATLLNRGVGAANEGDDGTKGTVTADITLTSLGFTVRLNGNVLLISRADSAAFSVDTSDGLGDTYMKAVKESVQSFSELPRNAFEGFTTKVKGTNRETADDYFAQFMNGDGAQGLWQEVVAPGTPLGFDADTMPHALVNTGVGAFTFKAAPWGSRVSGDGVTSSKDPSFVGQQIYDIFYDNSRLAILTEGTCVWSRSEDPFVYFPSAAQTVLADDPVDSKIMGGKQIVLLRKSVQTDEATFLWAQKAQFRVSSGQDNFRQDTIQSKKSTSYEFAEAPDPLPVADSLYFATEPGRYGTIRDLTILDGKPRGATDVTAHVKKYIPSGIRHWGASDTLGIMAVSTKGAPSNLYLYNFLIGSNDSGGVSRLQSAWNTWRLPAQGKVIWVTIQSERMDVVLQRPEGVLLCTVDLSQEPTDEGHDDYLTRLDLRVTEAEVAATFNPGTGNTTIVLPYEILEAVGDEAREPAERRCMVVQRETLSGQRRGYTWPIKQVTGNTVVVEGNAQFEKFYVGLRITAERIESRFYVRGPQGVVPTVRLQVVNYTVSHAKTGYYRAEVTYNTANLKQGITTWSGRVMGSQDNIIGASPIGDGQLIVPVNSVSDGYTLRLVNDSFLPSRWQTSEYQYNASFLAQPQRSRGAGA